MLYVLARTYVLINQEIVRPDNRRSYARTFDEETIDRKNSKTTGREKVSSMRLTACSMEENREKARRSKTIESNERYV